MFWGEAAGPEEIVSGIPFYGAAGGMFGRMLKRSHLERDNVRVGNIISCLPPGMWLEGAPWEHAAINHCAVHRQPLLDEPHKVIVTMGGVALKTILGLQGWDGIRVQDFHGTVHRDPSDKFWVVPTYHPSHLQRGAIGLLDVVKFDLDVANKIVASGGYTRRPHTLVQDPPLDWFAAWVAAFLVALAADPEGIWLAVDIETPDKAGGKDEGELSADDQSTQILRINFSCNPDEGVTVPYAEAYLPYIRALLSSTGVKLAWNKVYDLSRLKYNQIDVQGETWDLMWCAHRLHSDLPLGLGFWGPFYSDLGAWKHLGKREGKEAEYGAADGLQTTRVGHGLVRDLVGAGMWEAFERHTHELEQYALRPAHEVGILIDQDELGRFHEKLDLIAGEKLDAIKQTAVTGNLRPKAGYAKRPKGTPRGCRACGGTGYPESSPHDADIARPQCGECEGSGEGEPVPPKSVLGQKKGKERTAKDAYVEGGVVLVERSVQASVVVCSVCGAEGASTKKRCKVVAPRDGAGDDPVERPYHVVHSEQRTAVRWFWQLPFNPDSSQQILKYIKDTGSSPGRAKKTRKETTDKATIKKLAKQTGDPIYGYLLSYKAVKKVDSTYALGVKRRIWADGRIHPEPTFRPSMGRLSYRNPNPQNVVADKEGKQTLAAGFRRCVVAAPGCRLLEVDFSAIESVETGWWMNDPTWVRLSKLGVHSYLTSHMVRQEVSLQQSDTDLAKALKAVKKGFPVEYDRAKRCIYGNLYGLTPFGMVENFPDDFPTVKIAEGTQEMLYAMAPKLKGMHRHLREVAFTHGHLGGPAGDFAQTTSTLLHHPFNYRHDFFGVLTYQPTDMITARKWMKDPNRKDRIVLFNGRPFKINYGEDAKRVIAFPPQSSAAGVLIEAMLRLFHPESPSYIGDMYYGQTPLRAPIHDSLLLEIPDQVFDWVASIVLQEMQRPIAQQPIPAEWGMGEYLQIGVAAKASKSGGNWEDCEDLVVPAGTLSVDERLVGDLHDEEEYSLIEDLTVRVA